MLPENAFPTVLDTSREFIPSSVNIIRERG